MSEHDDWRSPPPVPTPSPGSSSFIRSTADWEPVFAAVLAKFRVALIGWVPRGTHPRAFLEVARRSSLPGVVAAAEGGIVAGKRPTNAWLIFSETELVSEAGELFDGYPPLEHPNLENGLPLKDPDDEG